MTKMQKMVVDKIKTNNLTELEKCLINERIGICECRCRTCPIGEMGFGTIGCLISMRENPLFEKNIDDMCYEEIIE